MRAYFLAFLALLAAGCSDQDVGVYRIPKENPAPAKAVQAGSSQGGLRWELPKGWTRQAASGMRLASFTVPAGHRQAEVSVVSLPGSAGGELSNVNRWRGQIGLPPLDEKGLAAQSRRLKAPIGELLIVDMTAEGRIPRKRLLAAMLSARGSTWFFKMTGDEEAVASAKPSFTAFLGSLSRDSD